MIDDYETKTILINKPVLGKKQGQRVRIPFSSDGVCTDANWRRVLKDAESDGCVEVMQPPKQSRKKQEAK